MNKNFILLLSSLVLIFTACSNNNIVNIKNERNGQLKQTVELREIGIKKFALDSNTAPKVQYTQLYSDNSGRRYFTLLNQYNNTIYFYDYQTLEFIKKITANNQKNKRKIKITGHYVKSIDSIYIYNRNGLELLLADNNGQILKSVSLIGNRSILKDLSWPSIYPQYDPKTAIPFIETGRGLLFPGQYMQSIPHALISKFNFITHIDFNLNKVSYSHTYPDNLYGYDYNWGGQIFTEVYTELHPDGNKLVFSFPIAHNIYVASINSNTYKEIYSGSNRAGTISSIDANPRETSRAALHLSVMMNDEYGAIKYDKYRHVYYRFLRKAIPNASENTQYTEKPIVVIIMDKNFNYLGETNIGIYKNWYIENAFVTKEGLNIEYIENNTDESFLYLKIFNLKLNEKNK